MNEWMYILINGLIDGWMDVQLVEIKFKLTLFKCPIYWFCRWSRPLCRISKDIALIRSTRCESINIFTIYSISHFKLIINWYLSRFKLSSITANGIIKNNTILFSIGYWFPWQLEGSGISDSQWERRRRPIGHCGKEK